MVCARLSGVLFKHIESDGVHVGVHKVAVLLAADLYYAYEANNPVFVNNLQKNVNVDLEPWIRVKDCNCVDLSRRGDFTVECIKSPPTVFVLSQTRDSGITSWRFNATSKEGAEMWTRALYLRITPMERLLPHPSKSLHIEPNWIFNPKDVCERLRTATEVGQPSRMDSTLEWVDLLLREAELFITGLEPLLLWAPIVGVAVHLLGYGVKIMSRVSHHHANRGRIERAHLAMESITHNVLGELSKCVHHAGVHRKRFEAIANILTDLEYILRAMDNFELSRKLTKMFRNSNVPVQILDNLEDVSEKVEELSKRVDLDIVINNTGEIKENVGQILELVRTMAEQKSAEAHHLVLDDDTKRLLDEIRGQMQSPKTLKSLEDWKSGLYAPSPSSNIFADFKDPNSLESRIKTAVLERDRKASEMRSFTTIPPPICVCGQAGAGKTIATISVLSDSDILERFCDGIFYKQLTHKTQSRDLICAWAEMIEDALGTEHAKDIKKHASIDDAQNDMKRHFRGRKTLLCVDNVWAVPTDDSSKHWRDEWLLRFRQIAGNSSTIIFTTRDKEIPIQYGCDPDKHIIHVSALYWKSPRAEKIFDNWLMLKPEERISSTLARDQILEKCAGLPLALSVAASSVKLSGYDWEYVLKNFDRSLAEYAGPVADKTLYSAIQVSVDVLSNQNKTNGVRFQKLSVFQRKAKIPLRILAVLWGCDAGEARRCAQELEKIALVVIERVDKDVYIELHESIHDWLRYNSERTPRHLIDYHFTLLKNFATQHSLGQPERNTLTPPMLALQLQRENGPEAANLLRSALAQGNGAFFANFNALAIEEQNYEIQVNHEHFSTLESRLEALGKTEWWRMVYHHAGQYMYSNLVHHLIQAGLTGLARNLVADIRWIRRRLDFPGDIVRIKTDLDLLVDELLKPCYYSRRRIPPKRHSLHNCGGENDSSLLAGTNGLCFLQNSECVWFKEATELKMIKNALESAAPALAIDPDQCIFQLCGRLKALATGTRGPIDELLLSAEMFSMEPSFLPLWQSFESPADHLRQKFGTHGKVHCIAVSPDARCIGIGMQGSDVVQVWDWDTATLIDKIEVKGARDVFDLAWLADSSALAVASNTSNVYVYRSCQVQKPNRDPVRILRGHTDAVSRVAASSAAISKGGFELIATGSYDHGVRLFDALDGTLVAHGKWHRGRITDLVWIRLESSNDRESLGLLSSSEDKTIALSNSSGVRLATFSGKEGHKDVVNGIVSLGPERPDCFATCSMDRTVKYWNLKTGKKLGEKKFKLPIVSIAFIPGTSKLVVAPKNFQLYTLDLTTSRTSVIIKRPHSGDVSCLSVAKRPDGFRVLSGSADDESCKIWDLTDIHEGNVLSYHLDWAPVHCVAVLSRKPASPRRVPASQAEFLNLQTDHYSKEQAVGISCSVMGGICAWDLQTGEKLSDYPLVEACNQLRKRPSIEIGSPVLNRVQLDVPKQERKDLICAVAALPSGDEFVTGSPSGVIHLWRLTDAGTITHSKRIGRHAVSVLRLGPIESGTYSLASVSVNGEVRLWELDSNSSMECGFDVVPTGQKLKKCSAFSVSDSRKLLFMGVSGTVGFCDVANRKFEWLKKKQKKWGSIQAVVGTEVYSDTLRIVAGMQDKTLRVFEGPRYGEGGDFVLTNTLCGGERITNETLSFVPAFRGAWFVSGCSKDHTLRLWNARKPEQDEEHPFLPLPKGSPGQSPSFHDDDFRDLLSTTPKAEERQGDSVVVVDMDADILSCQCFLSTATGRFRVMVGRRDGTVTTIGLSLPES